MASENPTPVKTKPAKRKSKIAARPKPRPLPLFNVVLIDDDDHSYEYVIEMLAVVFAYPPEKGFKMAEEVDTAGRVIVLTTHRERAELKRDQIIAYGADPRISRCKGGMTAVIEPAP